MAWGLLGESAVTLAWRRRDGANRCSGRCARTEPRHAAGPATRCGCGATKPPCRRRVRRRRPCVRALVLACFMHRRSNATGGGPHHGSCHSARRSAIDLLGRRGRPRPGRRRRQAQRGPEELVRPHARAGRVAVTSSSRPPRRRSTTCTTPRRISTKSSTTCASSWRWRSSGNEAVQFTPMLLLGEPGLGKTYFAKKLAHALATGFEFVSMSSLTAGWVLTGASAQWHNARPGKVAQTLIEGDYANPVVVLDEVDKAGGDARYDPMGALYTLARARHRRRTSRTSSSTSDMDASHILWVATANDESSIPEPDPQPHERVRDRPPGRRTARGGSRSPSTTRSSTRIAGRFPPSRRTTCSTRSPASRRATCASCCSMRSAPRGSPTAITSCPRTSTTASSAVGACASGSDRQTVRAGDRIGRRHCCGCRVTAVTRCRRRAG